MTSEWSSWIDDKYVVPKMEWGLEPPQRDEGQEKFKPSYWPIAPQGTGAGLNRARLKLLLPDALCEAYYLKKKNSDSGKEKSAREQARSDYLSKRESKRDGKGSSASYDSKMALQRIELESKLSDNVLMEKTLLKPFRESAHAYSELMDRFKQSKKQGGRIKNNETLNSIDKSTTEIFGVNSSFLDTALDPNPNINLYSKSAELSIDTSSITLGINDNGRSESQYSTCKVPGKSLNSSQSSPRHNSNDSKHIKYDIVLKIKLWSIIIKAISGLNKIHKVVLCNRSNMMKQGGRWKLSKLIQRYYRNYKKLIEGKILSKNIWLNAARLYKDEAKTICATRAHACTVITDFCKMLTSGFKNQVFRFLRVVKKLQNYIRQHLRRTQFRRQQILTLIEIFIPVILPTINLVISGKGLDMPSTTSPTDLAPLMKINSPFNSIKNVTTAKFHAYLRSNINIAKEFIRYFTLVNGRPMPIDKRKHVINGAIFTQRRKMVLRIEQEKNQLSLPAFTIADADELISTGYDKLTDNIEVFLKKRDQDHLDKQKRLRDLKNKKKIKIDKNNKIFSNMLSTLLPQDMFEIIIKIYDPNYVYTKYKMRNQKPVIGVAVETSKIRRDPGKESFIEESNSNFNQEDSSAAEIGVGSVSKDEILSNGRNSERDMTSQKTTDRSQQKISTILQPKSPPNEKGSKSSIRNKNSMTKI